MKKINILVIFLTLFINSYSQQLIKFEDALELSLKNNYNILIARNDADITHINNTFGNAGMLPEVGFNGSKSYTYNNINQKLSSGGEVNTTNAETNSLNAGIALNWTLFDGGRMFVAKSRLNEIEALGEIQYKEKVMNLVYEVTLAYYDVVRQKQQLSAINEVITYNLERVKIFDVSFGAGLTPKTNLLQAKIDLNVYQENAISQKTVISLSKRNLNQLLSREPNVDFEVEDSIPLNYNPDQQLLVQKIDSVNTTILGFQKQVSVSELSLKEYKASLLPQINANAGYNFLKTNNEAGTVLHNRTYGPTFGASIFIPFYQGGNLRRQIKTARIEVQSSQLDLENAKIAVNTQLQNALTQFANQKQLLSIEKENAVLAKENLEISMQRLRYGQTTSLEVREAQDSYEQSLTRLVNFKYNSKVAETRLKLLMSEL